MVHKRGSEKIFSFWWFLVLLIVFFVFSFGIFLFYSAEVDVRGLESFVLSEKIYACIVDNGILVDLEEVNLLSYCGLKEGVFSQNSNFYLSVSYLDKDFRYGNIAFEKDCKVSENKKADKFPRCTFSKKKVYSSNGDLIELNITTASNQKGVRR